MAVTINASTSTGLVQSADTSGQIELQTNGTTVATVNTSNNVQFKSAISVGNATPTTSGAGITFPATQSASSDANTLDDYEEGTWTPTASGTVTAGAATYSVRVGKYTKIGNVVTVNCALAWSAHTGSGDLVVGGLPFTSLSTGELWIGATYANAMNFGTSATQLAALLTGSDTTILFRGMINNATRATVPLDTVVDNLAVTLIYYV